MGDHQDCHGILCILHILYPEVPNRGPGIGGVFFRFSSRTFFFKVKGLLEFFFDFCNHPLKYLMVRPLDSFYNIKISRMFDDDGLCLVNLFCLLNT